MSLLASKFSRTPSFKNFKKIPSLICFLCLSSCITPFKEETKSLDTRSEGINFYIYLYDEHFKAAEKGEEALKKLYTELLNYTGKKSSWGKVGIGFVFPYLSWTEKTTTGPYEIPKKFKKLYEKSIKVASDMKLPVLVQFNGAVWHGADSKSSFLSDWKTKDGGKYLSRYKDGQVNDSIKNLVNNISKDKLKNFLNISPYDTKNAKDSLFFTLSAYAIDFQKSRLQTLEKAVHFWKKLDDKYSHTIQAFTTDSEVCNFSFRKIKSSQKNLPIGYEDFVTSPYCQKYQIKDCKKYFKNKSFNYKDPADRRWFNFRAHSHREFIKSTTLIIRKLFPQNPIYSHQIPVPDNHYIYKGRDFASPQSTAIIEGLRPGFTFYIYSKRDKEQKLMIQEIYKKSKGPWGFMEFNPGKNWKEGKNELKQYTYEIISYASKRGVRAIAPLSWQSNSLDTAVKGSGIDEGIKLFLEKGPMK